MGARVGGDSDDAEEEKWRGSPAWPRQEGPAEPVSVLEVPGGGGLAGRLALPGAPALGPDGADRTDVVCVPGCAGEAMVKDPETEEGEPPWRVGHFLQWLEGVRVGDPEGEKEGNLQENRPDFPRG